MTELNQPEPIAVPVAPEDVFRVQGTVKWFDPSKGFGFVVSDDVDVDILLHVNVLRNFGQSSVADGAMVDLEVHKTSRGIQALVVLAVQPSVDGHSAALDDIVGLDAATIANTPLRPARVKWFDKVKGFGFANVYGSRDDVFLHIEVLRQSGLSDLQSGEAIAARVIQGERGYLAAEVLAWESISLEDVF